MSLFTDPSEGHGQISHRISVQKHINGKIALHLHIHTSTQAIFQISKVFVVEEMYEHTYTYVRMYANCKFTRAIRFAAALVGRVQFKIRYS